MNTDKQLPVIERNFHIMNDDRFIMEKLSLPVEIQDGEDIHAAINRTRETIVQNFKVAYPKVYTHLNFDEVIQVKRDEKLWDEYVTKPEFEKAFGKINPNLVSHAQTDFYDNTKTPKPTIEERIDNSFNLIEEINKCKNVTMLKVYTHMCITKEEKQAHKNKYMELSKLQTT